MAHIPDVAAKETNSKPVPSRAELPKLYAWDEIGNCTMDWEPKELFDMNREGGWESQGWVENTDVRVVTNGRHFGLETWAESQQEAEAKFQFAKIYRDCNED